jgi:hypothetical protein
MPEFKRYQDQHGHKFTSALVEPKPGWKDITSDKDPALDRDGSPRAAEPASLEQAAKAKTITTAPARPGNSTEGA